MAHLKIIRGLPGSGKSTYAKKFVLDSFRKDFSLWAHLEADMYFVDKNGVYVFDREKLSDAHKWCFDTTRIFLCNEASVNVIVSNTFTKKWEIEKYINLAKELGVPYDIEVCTGNYGSVHGVPEEALKSMKERWEIIPGETIVGNNKELV